MMRITLAALLVGLAPASAAAPEVPTRFEASFVIETLGATVGRNSWRLIPVADNRFVWESRSRTAGIAKLIRDVTIVERSESEYVGDTVRPLVYEYDRSGDDEPRRLEIAFDWQQGLARNMVAGERWSMSVPDGTLDKINYLLVLMHDLAAGKRRMSYTVADGAKLKTYDMQVEGDERLDTALGELDTLRIRRIRDDGRETRVWCAPSLAYMPVRVRHTERDGWVVTSSIESVEGVEFAHARRPDPGSGADARARRGLGHGAVERLEGEQHAFVTTAIAPDRREHLERRPGEGLPATAGE